ncbi:MAG TPA: hypothetical protein VNZ56_04775 [Verrucomicrobiae bacterium]|nr:hypothetical protein [Verrucomicrobiae bacterium]
MVISLAISGPRRLSSESTRSPANLFLLSSLAMAEIMPQLARTLQTSFSSKSSNFLMERRFRYV